MQGHIKLELRLTIHQLTHQDDHMNSLDITQDINKNEILKIDGIDAGSALPRVNNNLELFKKILLIFLNNNQNSYQELSDAIQERRLEDSVLISHSLKGSAATIGANALSKIAAIIEQHLRNQNLNHALAQMEVLRNELNTVVSGLQTLKTSIEVKVTKQVFNRDDVLTTIDSIRTHLFEDLSNTEGLIDKMLAIEFPDIHQPRLAALKTEYEQFNLIQVEEILNQLYQMIANSHE